ncbi:MAG: hypothetical protein VB876_20090 [Pirellulales bacterium]
MKTVSNQRIPMGGKWLRYSTGHTPQTYGIDVAYTSINAEYLPTKKRRRTEFTSGKQLHS